MKSRLIALFTAFRGRWPDTLRDIAGVSGCLLISYGAWLIYEAAGFIIAGMFLVAGAVLTRTR